MRHIFVVNPNAGQSRGLAQLQEQILAAGKKMGVRVEIYETKAAGDGEAFVKRTCRQKAPDERIRFYACGGDGAVHEMANGVYGFDNVEMGCIPLGTGNDFIRNFGSAKDFLDIER